MSNLKENINKVKSATPSEWKQNAAFRLENRWLEYSSAIARRILAIIRDDEDLNQSRLAEALNVSPQQITKIVQGQENLTLETIYKLSKALNVDLITFPDYEFSKPIGETNPKITQAKLIALSRSVNPENAEKTYSLEK
jgi:transcriptional regulator with XRE-family HTH domain